MGESPRGGAGEPPRWSADDMDVDGDGLHDPGGDVDDGSGSAGWAGERQPGMATGDASDGDSRGPGDRYGQFQAGADSREEGLDDWYSSDLTGLDDEGYGDFQGDGLNEGGEHEFEAVLPVDGVASGGSTPPSTPEDIEQLHTTTQAYADSKTVEGGPENLRVNSKAAGSKWYPWTTKEQQMIWVWQHTYQISRKALGGLLKILLMEDEGKFDVGGLAGIDAEHFNARMRPYLPLLELVERQVKSTRDGETTAAVYDIPVNLLVHRIMPSKIPSRATTCTVSRRGPSGTSGAPTTMAPSQGRRRTSG